MWKRDQRRYNLTISTVFFFHLAMSAVIVAGTIIASCFVRELFHLPPGQDTGYYRLCFLVFGIGSAALFPMGVFPEMLADTGTRPQKMLMNSTDPRSHASLAIDEI